ncbi:MAG: tRNA (adenosine(37)-N6)-threonylcarbamoyltransferase complex dimerization subunit type 1 TsaB, partial [Oscillospiraceae bacterium]|nr:tRNA (adenosine(37)-N6)-threonylcarbamoyltransferase complex dimerization subunit type 1 TsaB [Oscillospiraceae bacterium]
MIILALDSTAVTASAALTDDRKLIGLYTLNTKLTHSETMLPMLENLLLNAKMNIGDVDLFACSSGPGSFTGVRIGISIVKGLAFAKNKPCVG